MTYLPNEFAKDPTLEEDMIKALAKDEDMKNPRPDLTFGLQRDKFPLDMPIPDHILDLLEIVPGMHHAFLLLEGKSPAGSLANAENQACRGGATLVKALRTLRALLENDTSHASEEIIQGATAPEGATPTKPDYKSFVFSATMNPAVFNIYVNWFDEGSKYYHKDLVESYALKNSKGPGEIREGLHNIIEWAVRTRRKQIEDLIRLIKDYTLFYWQRLQDEPTAKATAKTGKSAGEFGVQESDAN